MLIRLILAHVISDFPLQTNKIYNLKEKTNWGIFLHILVHVIVSVVLLYNKLNLQVLGILFTIGIIHFLQDWLKLFLKDRIAIIDTVSTFVVDQILHIGIIFFVFYIISPRLFGFIPPNLVPLSYNDKLGLLLTISILSSFGGSIAIYFVDKSVLKRSIPYKKDLSGLLERMLIPIIFFMKMNFVYIVLLIFIRAIYYSLCKRDFEVIRTINLFLSPLIALSLALFLFLF